MSRRQCAALPYAIRNGRIEILLVTSRETRRWIIPKGWTEKGRSASEQAAVEAWEEAGITGRIGDNPIGRFSYRKIRSKGKTLHCEVDVYPLHVTKEHQEWPERAERERCWMTPGQAAMAVREAGLVSILLSLAAPT